MNEDKSTRYHRLRRRAAVVGWVTRGVLLAGLLGWGFSPILRDILVRLASEAGTPDPIRASTVVAFYALILATLEAAIVLPVNWYAGFILERRFGLSRLRAVDWLRGHVQTTLVHLAVWMCGAVLVYAVMRAWPVTWWVVASVVFALLTIAITHVAPIITLPWLYHLRPLSRPALRGRLEALVRRAGAPVIGIHEWRLGSGTPRPNAALVGMGSTRRVLLTDALLADYSDDEIEVVLAHELAHHVHRDLWKTVAYETAAAALACGTAHWALHRVGPSLGLDGIADVAGLPLAVLAGAGVLMLLAPVANSLSRQHERRADRYALEVTGKPDALVSGLRRLAKQCSAEERPSRIVEWLFYSHPPLSDRLAAARAAKTELGKARLRSSLPPRCDA